MKILTVDDELVSREKMKKIMTGFGNCEMVDNGNAAVDIFRKAIEENEPFDLITIDISMPEMDGIEVLFRVRKIEGDLSIPKENQVKIIMVSSRSDKDTIITCLQAGCDNYIAKPFDKVIIVKKLRRMGLLDDQESPENEEESKVRDMVMETVHSYRAGEIDLPVLPQVIQDIQNEMKKPNSGVEELARLIEKDAVISMKLIATANSPMYRGTEKIQSVSAAIPRLGVKETQSIVSAIASKSLYDTKNKTCKELMERIWRHSLACAYSAKVVSEKWGLGDKEKLFIMGLLHDIGKVLLLKTVGLKANGAESFDRGELIDSIQDVHTSFGAALLDAWGFDREFADMASLHDWEKYESDTPKEILIINLANNLARYMEYSIFDNDEIDLSTIESAKLLKIETDSLIKITEDIKDMVGNSTNAF